MNDTERNERDEQPPPRETKPDKPRHTEPGGAVSGFPEPPGRDPGDVSRDPSPHHSLSTPVGEPDPTEWPDPYDRRDDPRDPPDPDAKPFGEEPHPQTGSTSTSDPHPSQDPEAADRWEAPKREKLDE
jgi:hypothetical protein